MNNIIEIDKGINLLHIESDKFKTITIAVLIRRKLSREEVTKNALIPQVLKRGSKKYPSLSEINKRAEDLYGAIFDTTIMKKGEEQIIQFYMEILNEKIEKNLLRDGLQLMKDVMLEPLTEGGGFNNEYTEGEKENLKRKIESRKNDKKEYAKLRLLEEMCKDEPFGIYGDGYAEDIEHIDSVGLYKHYKKILSESPINFIIIGNCDSNDMANYIKETFKLERTDINQIPKPGINPDSSWREKSINEQSEISQAKLCMGLRSNFDPASDEFYNLLVMNEIFGGSPDSKLFANVREKESLCYYVNSFIYRFKTILFIQSGIDENDSEKVIELIKTQLEEMRSGNINDDEIDKAKRSLIKKFKSIYDHPQAVMDFYLSGQMLNDNNSIDEVIGLVEKVSKEAVVDAAKKLYVDTIYLLCGSERD